MILHKTPSFTLYFGNRDHCVSAQELPTLTQRADAVELPAFKAAQKAIHADQLIFAHQVHGIQHMQVTDHNKNTLTPFGMDADFLITNVPKAGLGVLTADCVPIIIYDPMHHALALIHAGWRGSVAQIAQKAVEVMRQTYGTQPDSVKVFFGPAARACCYQVTEEFIAQVSPHVECVESVMQRHNNALYFDMTEFNLQQLLKVGIKKEACLLDYNICTICDPAMCSYRREGKASGRQITAICLT